MDLAYQMSSLLSGVRTSGYWERQTKRVGFPSRLHPRSIKPVFYGCPRPWQRAGRPTPAPGSGRLFSGTASALDAFRPYRTRRSCPAMPCRTTGRPETAAPCSSRTRGALPSGSQHSQQIESDLSHDGLNPAHVPL